MHRSLWDRLGGERHQDNEWHHGHGPSHQYRVAAMAQLACVLTGFAKYRSAPRSPLRALLILASHMVGAPSSMPSARGCPRLT